MGPYGRTDNRWTVWRITALSIGLLGAGAWLFVALASFTSIEPATRGLDTAFGWAVTAIFALTTVPGLLLAATGRAPRVALALGLAFPGVFILFYAAVAAWFLV